MLYPVNKPFKDMQDKGREYRSNDWYPRFNFDVNDKRIEQLIELEYIKEQKQEEYKNQEGEIISRDEEVPSAEYPIHTGGGWYELSNGESVQGKKNAIKEEKLLKK